MFGSCLFNLSFQNRIFQIGFVGAAAVAAAADVAAAALSSLSSLSSRLICSRCIVPNWFEFGMCLIFVLCFDMRCFHIGCCSHRVFLLGNFKSDLLESIARIEQEHLSSTLHPSANENHMLSNKTNMKQTQTIRRNRAT